MSLVYSNIFDAKRRWLCDAGNDFVWFFSLSPNFKFDIFFNYLTQLRRSGPSDGLHFSRRQQREDWWFLRLGYAAWTHVQFGRHVAAFPQYGRLQRISRIQSPLLFCFQYNHIHPSLQSGNSFSVIEFPFFLDFGITTGEQISSSPCAFRFNSTTSTNGTFWSPNFPGFYPRDTECHYFFHAQVGERVKIVFSYFDIEGMVP